MVKLNQRILINATGNWFDLGKEIFKIPLKVPLSQLVQFQLYVQISILITVHSKAIPMFYCVQRVSLSDPTLYARNASKIAVITSSTYMPPF